MKTMVAIRDMFVVLLCVVGTSNCNAFSVNSNLSSPARSGNAALYAATPRKKQSVGKVSDAAAKVSAAAAKVTAAAEKIASAARAPKVAPETTKTFVVEEEVVRVLKPELVSLIARKAGMSKTDCEAVLTSTLDVIAEEVASGHEIPMMGFGTFKLTRRAARKGRNPRTGEEIDIKASNTPRFSAGKTFKDRCNIPPL